MKLLALSLLALNASAAQVQYSLTFTVEQGSVRECDAAYSCVFLDAVGNKYHGAFSVDDAILATDGLNKPGVVGFFLIQMEDNIWGYNSPLDNAFVGFRGPAGLLVSSPGFDVVKGQIVNLRGGVVGIGDVPFVDFSPGVDLPGCPGEYCGGSGHTFDATGDLYPHGVRYVDAVYGSMAVRAVPLPAVGWLLGPCLLVMLGFPRSGDSASYP